MKYLIFTLSLFLPFFVFADVPNHKLEKYISTMSAEINKFSVSENKCKNGFYDLEGAGDWLWSQSSDGTVSLFNSFTEIFAGNSCFQRDLKKINKLYDNALNQGAELKRNCLKKEVLKKDGTKQVIEDLVKDIKNEKGKFLSGKDYLAPNLYGKDPVDCKSDFYSKTSEKAKELKDKITSLGDSSNGMFDFAFDKDKAAENARKNARQRLSKNLNSYTKGLGITVDFYKESNFSLEKTKGFLGKMMATMASALSKGIVDPLSLIRESLLDKSGLSYANSEKDMYTISATEQIRTKKKEIIDYNLENFTEEPLFSEISGNSSNDIVKILSSLRFSIVATEGTIEDIKELGEYSEDSDLSLRRFIKTMKAFLEKHNTAVSVPASIFIKKDYY